MLNEVLFQASNSFKLLKNHLKREKIEEICDKKVCSIEYYGRNVNTLIGTLQGLLLVYITLSYLNWPRNGELSKLEVQKKCLKKVLFTR